MMNFLSFLAASLALSHETERGVRTSISAVNRAVKDVIAKSGPAEAVGKIDQEREAPIILHKAIGHYDHGRLMGMINMAVENIGRCGSSGPIYAHSDLRANLIAKLSPCLPFSITIMACINDIQHLLLCCLDDSVIACL
jgi:hypothetical protein